MNWKVFKKHISTLGKPFQDETKFVLGIDIGTKTSVISFWNVNRIEPEMIDMSGGYGKASIPTVIQYIPETKEWVYGEYALLNKGFFHDITFTDLTKRLGTKELIDIDGRPMNVPLLISRYIRELVEACKNMNPNGEVVGVVASIPTYMSKEAQEEFRRAFALAGLEKELIDLVPERECILRYFYTGIETLQDETVLILDYGGQELRGSVLSLQWKNESQLKAVTKSSLFDPGLGSKQLEQILLNQCIDFYCQEMKILSSEITPQTLQQLEILCYQNKSLLFQSEQFTKTVKLYFNFAYPAFQKIITGDMILSWIQPFKTSMEKFLQHVCHKTIDKPIHKNDITKVIVLGGGFEMQWAKNLVESTFPNAKFLCPKEPEGIVSLGACIGAASTLGISKQLDISIEDRHQISQDIGLRVRTDRREQFVPIIEKNSFWWQPHKPKMLLLDCLPSQVPLIDIYQQTEEGDEILLSKVPLENLPKRPSRMTRLKISLELAEYNLLKGRIKDLGFGEFFPATNYEQTFTIQLSNHSKIS